MRARSLEVAEEAGRHPDHVAAKSLRYGVELTAQSLREIPWPDAPLPDGAFARIADLLRDGKRIVLTAIEPNEPVLSVKVTGPGQRATLSALVRPGMKAVTVRVNDVDGVGGFVQPGDRVDVALTRQIDKENASTQVVLQDVRVLAIDQVADERATNPAVAKSVTSRSTPSAPRSWGSPGRSEPSRCCCARPARPRRKSRCGSRSRTCTATWSATQDAARPPRSRSTAERAREPSRKVTACRSKGRTGQRWLRREQDRDSDLSRGIEGVRRGAKL